MTRFKKWLLAFAVLAGIAAAPLLAGLTISGSIYYATDSRYGACTWSTAGGADVGPCINAAYTACATATGGNIMLPAGNFNVATQIRNGVSGCKMVGAGVGQMRDSSTPSAFVAVTELTWTGAADATMFLDAPSGTRTLYDAGVTGVVFNCASLAGICAEFEAVTESKIDIGWSDARSIGVYLTTEPNTFTDGPGTQHNDVTIQGRSTSATYSPTGMLCDGASGSSYNCSLNRFHRIVSWVAKGDGVVFGYSDNNTIDQLITYNDPTNEGGTPVVFASSGYVQKNGLTVAGASIDNTIAMRTEAPVHVQGFTSGSTITAAGGNGGTAAVTTVPKTLTSATSNLSQTLTVSGGFSNVLPGMTASCTPNAYCGIIAGNPVTAVGATTATLGSQTKGINNSTVITFSYGITQYAVPGSYTMTAVDGTHWTLTAPGAGHSQSNIAVASGAISFTDMVIPLTGTPNANDTFTIVVPTPSSYTQVLNVDKSNSIQDPTIEPGASATVSNTKVPFPSNYTSTLYTPTSPVLTGTIPVTATEVRIVEYGQGGCGGGGINVAAGGSASGGAGGGGGGVKDSGWFPASNVSGTYTVSFGTQCTSAAAGASGSVGGNAVFSMTGFPTTTAYGGGAGAVGASAANSGGGGGAGTIAAGNSVTGTTGGAAANFGGTAGGSGIGAANNASPMGSPGGGGSSSTGVPGADGFAEFGGAAAGSGGGGCNAGTGQTGSNGHSPITLTTISASGTKGTDGTPGVDAGLTGSGIGVGGGSGTSGAGNDGSSSHAGKGGDGGAGGAGGAGGGSACGTSAVGGAGGVGGRAQVLVLTR